MKSLQVMRIQPHAANAYSDLQVCSSAAGYFVGTTCGGSPGSRDTDYFATKGDAEFALAVLERMYAEHVVEQNKWEPDPPTDTDFSADYSAVLHLCGLDQRGVGYRLEP